MSEHRLIYITTADREEALRLARTLVAERLVACANILGGARSVYRWEGQVEEAEETILIVKTVAVKAEDVVNRIKGLHSYSCPCAVILPIEGGNPDFLAWISRESL